MPMHAQRTTPCKSCGEPTTMLYTELCGPCWNLDIRTAEEDAREEAREEPEWRDTDRPHVEPGDCPW